ncbi:MAG: cupin domain-containing protein [Gammaproteobacteria bacterium]|jgi:quercetin dioxygenase-like cupin family protein
MRQIRIISVALCFSVVPLPAAAHEAQLAPLMNVALPDLPGHQVTMLKVTYPPGGYSGPHNHKGAHTFVYVLSGALEMGVADQESVVMKPGETFYENPADVHNVLKNAGTDEAAEFLVFFLHPEGMMLVTPVETGS